MVGIPVVIITSWILYERSELSIPFYYALRSGVLG
jgi:hypothetical protein